jgi:hypothetical protein
MVSRLCISGIIYMCSTLTPVLLLGMVLVSPPSRNPDHPTPSLSSNMRDVLLITLIIIAIRLWR